jgi:hypothetical protein
MRRQEYHVEGPKLLHPVITFRVEKSFTERPNESNSMEHQVLKQ